MCGKFQGPPANVVNLDRFLMANTELQSYRVTELQTPKGTQYIFFVPDFNKLPYLLRSHGDYIVL